MNQEPDVACPVVLLVLLVGGCAAGQMLMFSTRNSSMDYAVVAVGGRSQFVTAVHESFNILCIWVCLKMGYIPNEIAI